MVWIFKFDLESKTIDMLDAKEINDSYNNAKRIQDSILPSETYIRDIFPDSFVLYLPRDIVSGDFYWIEEVNETIIFAVADCTGHGIPGALLTVLCHNALDKSLKDFGLLNPGHLLDKTLEILASESRNAIKSISDGMDIALCTLTGRDLQYSGANNPLWIIHNDILTEHKATKQSVGLIDMPSPFITEEFNLAEGNTVYIFSDGFSDQFGGKMDKKFKTTRLKSLLTSINHKPINEQKIILEREFIEWKGSNDQTDDVCIMGVKI